MILTNIPPALRRIKYLVIILALCVAMFPVLLIQRAAALPLSDRSLMVTSTVASDNFDAPDGTTYTNLSPGDPRNGAKVGHTYTFTVSSDVNIKAITLQYCDSPFGYAGTCTVPSGFSAAAWGGANVDVTVDDGVTPATESWAVANTGSNLLTISNGSSSLVFENGDVVTIQFTAVANDYFVNPNTNYLNNVGGSPQQATYFAHIVTHNTASIDTGDLDATMVDDGTVTNDVTTAISIYTRVQETLNFSVEGHASTDPAGPSSAYTPGGPCTALTRPGNIRMGDSNDALSSQQAYFAKSYFRLSTNSAKGTAVYYAGETLTSGTNTIEAIWPTRQTSSPGTEQFGLAFDLTDNISANVGITGQLIPAPQYNNNANGYAFNASSPAQPKLLAGSLNVVTCDTGSIEYIANIAPDTPAGIYQTKINYISAPKY